MYHFADKAEMEMTSKLDFVVPLKQVGLITRAVLEAIRLFYAPRRIIVVSSRSEGEIIRSLSPHWNAGKVDFVAEETFFERHYGLTLQQILAEYDPSREGDQREPGWWIQQLIKLGAATQIPDLSTNYVVWDGDLIPTRRWKLAERDRSGRVKYFIAVLQAEARSEFNSYQYAMCMRALTGDTPRGPQGGGTFVAHHMVFNRHYVQEMLEHMCSFTRSPLPWPLLIMSFSRRFYRFSEYKTYATFMLNRHPADFHYHPLACYGEGGVRFRDANRIVENMLSACPLSGGGLSYEQVILYAQQHMDEFRARNGSTLSSLEVRLAEPASTVPGYIQLDHVYGIAKLGLDPAGQPVLLNTTSTAASRASTGSLDLTELISAAYAVTAPVVADDLKSETLTIEVDLVAAPGSCSACRALGAGIERTSSPSGAYQGAGAGTAHTTSNLTPSAEFKITRLRINPGSRRANRSRRVAEVEGESNDGPETASPAPLSPTAKEKASSWVQRPGSEKGMFRWALPS